LAELNADQADGLRRMFRGERMRVIHIVAGREDVGRTAVATNLGVALAQSGRETLLADCVEPSVPGRALAYLGLSARASARDMLASIVPGPKGLAVLALQAEAFRAGRLDVGDRSALGTALLDYAVNLDYLLASSRSTLPIERLPVEDERRDVVVVLSRASSSITQAYALIKRLSLSGVKRRFQVLVNRVASDTEAALIFRNMAAVAQGYLDVQLDMLGFIPDDEHLERSTREGKNVIESAPKSAAARAFRRLAEDIAGWSVARPAPAIQEPGRRRRAYDARYPSEVSYPMQETIRGCR